MRSNCISGSRNYDSDRDGEKFVVKQLEGQFLPGDVTWAKLRGNIWWPAVLFSRLLTRTLLANAINLVTEHLEAFLSGFMEAMNSFLYVDPIKFHSEFQKVLEQNNGSYSEIFEKALEQDCSHMKSGCSKGKGSKSTEGKYKSNSPSADEEVKRKCSKQGSRHKKLKPNNTSDEKRRMSEISMEEQDEKSMLNGPDSEASLLRTSHELSARRLRVMQSLGLIAPSGSPFC